MFVKPMSFLVIFAVVFFIFNAAHASLEKEKTFDAASVPAKEQPQIAMEGVDDMEEPDQVQDETKTENEAQDLDAPEVNVETPNEDVQKRKPRVPCYCWIGWVKKKHLKYKNFGRIRKFRWFEIRKQSKCSASCSKKCAPWLKKKAFLCKKIGKTYHYKQHKVGCFSQVGRWDWPSNLWDFDGSPHNLCCKKTLKSCSSVYGSGFFYHSGLKLCVKYLTSGCIPGFPNGTSKPPVCCYGNHTYACQKPKYYGKNVPCW